MHLWSLLRHLDIENPVLERGRNLVQGRRLRENNGTREGAVEALADQWATSGRRDSADGDLSDNFVPGRRRSRAVIAAGILVRVHGILARVVLALDLSTNRQAPSSLVRGDLDVVLVRTGQFDAQLELRVLLVQVEARREVLGPQTPGRGGVDCSVLCARRRGHRSAVVTSVAGGGGAAVEVVIEVTLEPRVRLPEQAKERVVACKEGHGR